MSGRRISSQHKSGSKSRADSYGFRPANPTPASREQSDFDDPSLAAMGRSFSLGPGPVAPIASSHYPLRPYAASLDHASGRAAALASIARPGHFHRAGPPLATRTPHPSPVVAKARGLPPLPGRPNSHSSMASSGYSLNHNTRQGYTTNEQLQYPGSHIHTGTHSGSASSGRVSSGYASGVRTPSGSTRMSSLGSGSGFSSLSRFTGSGYDQYGGYSGLSAQSGDSGSTGWSMAQTRATYHHPLRPGRYSTLSQSRGGIYREDHDDTIGGMSYALAGLSISGFPPQARPGYHPEDHHSAATFVVEPSDAGSESGEDYFDSGSSSAYTDEYEADYDYDEDDEYDEYSGGDHYYGDEYSDD
ncbi:hypothetical protein C8F01DRAFT_622127 [Mycena amicta]|nr:hypothetical protein C8F01DRAFT_622127 [Mycena amicta]